MGDLLPSKPDVRFLWDVARRRYISTSTGRAVKEQTVKKWVREIGDTAKQRMRSITEREVAGDISRASWELAMRDEIKNLHRTMATIARGGKEQMTQRDWGRVGNVIAKQNAYLNQFGSQVAHGQVSDAQQLARAELYANSAFSTYENAVAVRNAESGVTRARRVLEDGAAHCADCEDFATDEFIPLDEIVPIGQSECQSNCRCTIEYEDAPKDEQQLDTVTADEAAA